jgi:VWFA-related protein
MMRRDIATALLVVACATSLLAQESATPPDAEPSATQEAGSTAAAQAEEAPPAAPPTFPAEIEQVIVDLVVADKKGNPVKGFTQDDLIITEDGTPQSIVSFEAIELPEKPAPTSPPPPKISINTIPEAKRGRTFVVVFDDMHITPYRARDAKAAVASFLENGVREGDNVTLISTSGGTWWTSRMNAGREKLIDTVKALDGRYIPDSSLERISDWEAMRIHVYRDPQTVNRVYRRFQTYGVTMRQSAGGDRNPMYGTAGDPLVTMRASEVYYSARSRYRVTLEALERAANGLAVAGGRKSIILISEGFIHDPNADEFKRVTEACRRANTAIYFVNARGLEGMPTYMTAEFGPALPEQDVGAMFAETREAVGGSENVASDSGGFTVRNTNDLTDGIRRIAEEMRIYYFLGYIPTNTARDGEFRKIKVKFKKGVGKGLKIRARKGYYAPTADGSRVILAKEGVDPVFQTVLDSPWAEDGIPLRMTHYVGAEQMLGKAEVLIATEVDIRGLDFKTVEDREHASIEFLLVVVHRESGEYFRYDQTVHMKLRPSTRERLNRVWFPVVRDFELQPGDHQAKIVIRQASTGVVGSVVHEFDVPALDKFRVSTPIITDIHRPKLDGPGVKPQLLARRAFPQGSDVVCSFEVFGAAQDETGMPQVVQGYKIERSDGVVYRGMPESFIRPTSLGSLTRLFGFSLRDARPGDYQMQLTFRDELSGETIELQEPFSVVPAEPTEGANGPTASSS